MKPVRPFTDAEMEAFENVCDRLGGFDDRVGPEWADGWLTALACLLSPPPFEEWVARLAGDAYERAFADPEDQARARQALQARFATLCSMLDAESLDEAPDAPRLLPILGPWSDEERARVQKEEGLSDEEAARLVTGADWADGFFEAMDALGEGAFPSPLDEEGEKLARLLLGDVHALRLPDGSAELRELLGLEAGAEFPVRDQLLDNALFSVQDFKLWVVDNAPKPVTRQVEKTPGRNDPCPCGSGKKYKKCHGAG